ncbi:major allergen Pru ar 1-like [Coffea eugenioides]|uniref:major allergen Pru ar 1-like n=1 Tax=Coffea eugenioides TaxID=49369 RepID=UPI000F604F80|nr:major allergen Pru ar 1-like [Coffea eugenioides]
MAPLTCDFEVPCSIPPARLFKAFFLDDHLITKMLPQAIKSVEIVEGDGGVGSIKLITFGEGSHYKGLKQRVDGIDKDNFTFSHTILESDAFSDKIEKVANVIKIEASADGGSICKTTRTCHLKRNTNEHIEGANQEIRAAKETSSAMFKAVEAYLIANPDVYN